VLLVLLLLLVRCALELFGMLPICRPFRACVLSWVEILKTLPVYLHAILGQVLVWTHIVQPEV
jgi:hypothetical protein